MEDLWQRLKDKEKELSEKERLQNASFQKRKDDWNRPEEKELSEEDKKTAPFVEEKVTPVEIIPEQSDKPLEEDLSWEDKGEKIGDEIKVEKENDNEPVAPAEQMKRKYERDFLLQFQFLQMCTEKPAGLPDIEVVLDAPAPPSKGSGSQRGGGSDFLPSFARKSKGGGGRRDSRGKPPARKMITAVPAPPFVLKQGENRWQRPEEKEKELTEEEKKSAELYCNVVAILNKLTPQKFKTLVEQIMALNIETPERLEGVIDRIFEKAIGEPVFSVAYHANMCRCLFSIKVTDVEGKDVSFRKLLLNRCQKEFEKEKEDEQAMSEKLTQLEGLSEEEKKVKKEEMDETMAKNKRRMLGNIKFIGELFKLKLLTENIMHDCVYKLLRAGDEESLESVCMLLFTIGKDLDSDRAKPRIDQYFDQINRITAGKKVSQRVIFMLRDVVDLRQNKWIPRREENYNPKTIDQIHKKAQLEKAQQQEQRLAAQMPAKDNKQKKGGSGGQDSPKPSLNDVLIDQNELGSMAALFRPCSGGSRGSDKSRIKSDKDRESALEAVRALTKAQNEKPQVTQLPSTSQKKQEVKVIFGKEPLSEEELIKKTTALIDEYAIMQDVKEAVTCFTDLHSPTLHHLFVLTAVEYTYEMSSKARHDIAKLFAELLSQNKLSKEQLTAGFNSVLEVAYDNAIDYPMLWKYLAEIITPVVLGDQFTLSDLKPMILEHLVPVGKAAALLAEILLIAKELEGESKAAEIWTNAGISWSEVLPERLTKEDFFSRKNLNFLPNENNDELLKLLRADPVKNDTVFAHIERKFTEEETKEAQFINHLVKAVVESCIINRDQVVDPDCCKDKLKARKDILRKYLNNNITLELEALFALQEIYVKYNKPADLLERFFNTLYDEEVITEKAFMSWKYNEDPSRQEAKRPALQATYLFFVFRLESAAL